MKLIIGNKRLSSWSLRPWILLEHFGIPFEEVLIPLDQPNTHAEILKYAPIAKVPALVDGDLTVWDSLAICEYLNDKFPDRQMWPRDLRTRAVARSVSAEMHSSFAKMRQLLSHDLQRHLPGFDWSPAKADVERVKQIWSDALAKSGGPFLFGEFSIADAMFAPVVNRFITYDVATSGVLAQYIETIRSMPAHQKWIEAALRETHVAELH